MGKLQHVVQALDYLGEEVAMLGADLKDLANEVHKVHEKINKWKKIAEESGGEEK